MVSAAAILWFYGGPVLWGLVSFDVCLCLRLLILVTRINMNRMRTDTKSFSVVNYLLFLNFNCITVSKNVTKQSNRLIYSLLWPHYMPHTNSITLYGILGSSCCIYSTCYYARPLKWGCSFFYQIIEWFEQYAEEFFETNSDLGDSLEVAQALVNELMEFEENTKVQHTYM